MEVRRPGSSKMAMRHVSEGDAYSTCRFLRHVARVVLAGIISQLGPLAGPLQLLGPRAGFPRTVPGGALGNGTAPPRLPAAQVEPGRRGVMREGLRLAAGRPETPSRGAGERPTARTLFPFPLPPHLYPYRPCVPAYAQI
eukprot:scaffold351_cov371-Prasinococcus_capsulatus_cf.AAC.1